jgi:hypothetical protein
MTQFFANLAVRLQRGGSRLAVITFLALGVTACVSPGPVREAQLCGQKVSFHPDNLTPCTRGTTACTVQTSTSSYAVHYSTMDEAVLAHEEEHVCGMRHKEPWVPVAGKACTVVTDPGKTAWKKGDVMCRVDAGPPIKITDARVLNFVLSAR